jgi:uncharacterized protein (TIGR03790 family)
MAMYSVSAANRMKSICIAASALLLLSTLVVQASGLGDEVIVIYNSRMPESKELADYYAHKRGVPKDQIFGFELTTTLAMSRSEFRTTLQKPLAKLLESRKLWRQGTQIVRDTNGAAQRVEYKVTESKIRYAVLCYGVPASINPEQNFKEPGLDKLRPEMRRDEAAVDTELALLPMIEENLPLAGPLRNPVFAATNPATLHPTNGVLMVTRLDGPTVAIARGLVDKALEAETNGLWGRTYFDIRGIMDPGYKPGDDWIRGASEVCQRLGFEMVLDQKPETFPPEFPMSQIAVYCGWYDFNVSGPFTRPKVEFMPGAFAYHLHSYSGANIRSATNYWVGPLLAKGATITMGCVTEPYLGTTPQVGLFLARFLYERMTFGEAAYAAQPVLSWQTTIIGDPLYTPYRQTPQQLHEHLQAIHSPLIEWSHLRAVDLNLVRGASPRVGATYLETLDVTKKSAVLSEKLADLYEALGKPASAIETYEHALNLIPSPEQKVRLRLKLADKFTESNLEQKACEDYLSLLRENPDYPNKLEIYRKMLPLAQKLGNTADVARYSELIRVLTPPPPTNAPPGELKG